MNKLPLLPKKSFDTEPFWDYCCKHEFRLQKCADCGTVRWPASIVCPNCLSGNFDWELMSGKGKIYSFVIFHKAFHKNFKDKVPYVVAIIALDEGPKFLSNVVNCDISKVACEKRVSLTWLDNEEAAFAIPVFELEG